MTAPKYEPWPWSHARIQRLLCIAAVGAPKVTGRWKTNVWSPVIGVEIQMSEDGPREIGGKMPLTAVLCRRYSACRSTTVVRARKARNLFEIVPPTDTTVRERPNRVIFASIPETVGLMSHNQEQLPTLPRPFAEPGPPARVVAGHYDEATQLYVLDRSAPAARTNYETSQPTVQSTNQTTQGGETSFPTNTMMRIGIPRATNFGQRVDSSSHERVGLDGKTSLSVNFRVSASK